MRFLTGILFFVCLTHTGYAYHCVKDSLLQVLEQENRPQQKCVIYQNLADICYGTDEERTYLKLLIKEAERIGNKDIFIGSMAELVTSYLSSEKTDSAALYIKQFSELDQTEEVKSWLTFLNMNNFNLTMSQGDGREAMEDALKKLKSENEEDIYQKIENAYAVANGLYTLGKFEQALQYAQTAEKLAATLPFKTGCKIHLYAIKILSRILTRNRKFDAGITWMEKYIELQEKYYEQYYKPYRPYYYINSQRISAYSTIMTNILALPSEKADHYFKLVQEYSSAAINLYDKYQCYHIMYNYYAVKKDLPKATEMNDSLIVFSNIIAKYNVPGLYRIGAALQELQGNYKEALAALKIYYALQDSVNTIKSQEHLNQLQVQYDVNSLNYENSQLEINNKKILLICLAFILILLSILCTYLYKNLQKERAMKIRLCELNAKAEESEKMKTLFIRSVCHEIRTPLNAILGFSELLNMPDFDEEMRQTFPEEIHKNSILLTSLISRMLEVAELDVSNEKLPVESTDIHAICAQSMERIQGRGKKEIAYTLDNPDEPFAIRTHTHYLTLVLENLLDNASKFTENGNVILHYEVKEDKLSISVTDTGCGIPVEMHKKVFERFSKLNAYKPGNGLGLYLCQLIIHRLSGNIYIDTAYTEGTRVWIELPLQTA